MRIAVAMTTSKAPRPNRPRPLRTMTAVSSPRQQTIAAAMKAAKVPADMSREKSARKVPAQINAIIGRESSAPTRKPAL
ncbi:hypothetical protein D9M71_782370 [compost metagenome]